MGVRAAFVRDAVDAGELVAEDVTVNGKRLIRIHFADFVAWLRAIGWSRIPQRLE